MMNGDWLARLTLADWVLGALVVGALCWLAWLAWLPPPKRRWLGLHACFARLIERALGGYRQQIAEIDERLPLGPPGERRRVAVIGGGIAGISAADTLARRGFEVTLLEKNDYLGGKIGAWRERFDDGFEAEVEHGFHAFFRSYYNLDRLLERVALRQQMRSIGEYLIIERDGSALGFSRIDTTPVLNLFSMASAGVFRWREVFGERRTLDNMDAFLRYEPKVTFEQYDSMSFAEFADRTRLPQRLRLVFTTFSRAFFADEWRMSMAELLKSFHFYYLSNDTGLIYDYPADDYQRALIGPLQAHLEQSGVQLRLGEGVSSVTPRDDGTITVDGRSFDHVVLACDVVGARAIAERSPALSAGYTLGPTLSALRPSQRYAVQRVWSDRRLDPHRPVFVITERQRLLDAVTDVSRVASSARRWADESGGGVYELHCYAVPDEIIDRSAVRDHLIADAERLFPELTGQTIRYEHLQVNANFAAFHVGMGASRPGVRTDVPSLYLAGDWVALPRAAMLMEAACMSGLLAANEVLASVALRREPVYAVPERGLMARWPTPPKKYPVLR
jgi:isorenieratene synthase